MEHHDGFVCVRNEMDIHCRDKAQTHGATTCSRRLLRMGAAMTKAFGIAQVDSVGGDLWRDATPMGNV